ncbi:MAG: prepilin peptidase [Candidatus Magasanikbacteria bacterium]|nr:prepilin peptidase [Candidatus Magasanikbacteria bacterium]
MVTMNLSPLFGYVFLFFLGTCLGSYLNSWMWRTYKQIDKGSDLLSPTAHTPLPRSQRGIQLPSRSVCVHCHRQLEWFENIPLVSFLILRGKCRTCKKIIPMDYFVVELVVGLGFLFLGWYHFNSNQIVPALLFRDFFFFSLFTVIFAYDLKYYLIISNLVWVGSIVAFVVSYFFLGFSTYSLLLGILIASGFFLLQYLVSRGKWIGGGDVRLGVVMGALLGFPNILVALFLAYVGGGLISLPLVIFKKKGMQSQIPFGTFLSVATLVAMLWGRQVADWYVGLIGL